MPTTPPDELLGQTLILSCAADVAACVAKDLHLSAEERWLDLIWEQLYAIGNGCASAADLDAIEKITHDSMRSEFDCLTNGETVLAVMQESKIHLRST